MFVEFFAANSNKEQPVLVQPQHVLAIEPEMRQNEQTKKEEVDPDATRLHCNIFPYGCRVVRGNYKDVAKKLEGAKTTANKKASQQTHITIGARVIESLDLKTKLSYEALGKIIAKIVEEEANARQ